MCGFHIWLKSKKCDQLLMCAGTGGEKNEVILHFWQIVSTCQGCHDGMACTIRESPRSRCRGHGCRVPSLLPDLSPRAPTQLPCGTRVTGVRTGGMRECWVHSLMPCCRCLTCPPRGVPALTRTFSFNVGSIIIIIIIIADILFKKPAESTTLQEVRHDGRWHDRVPIFL